MGRAAGPWAAMRPCTDAAARPASVGASPAHVSVAPLLKFGTVLEIHQFAQLSRTAVMDLRDPPTGKFDAPPLMASADDRPLLTGCIGVRLGRRW
jgi:hypothetical protein